jgi:hypothetical protein
VKGDDMTNRKSESVEVKAGEYVAHMARRDGSVFLIPQVPRRTTDEAPTRDVLVAVRPDAAGSLLGKRIMVVLRVIDGSSGKKSP